MTGPTLGYIENREEGRSEGVRCKNQTAKLLVALSKLDVTKISQLVFHHWDMLSPGLVERTKLSPCTNLRQVHFYNCREITMQKATSNFLGKFDFKISYTYNFLLDPTLTGSDFNGAVLSSLYFRKDRIPHNLVQNLLDNHRFRAFVEYCTNVSADDWYGGITGAPNSMSDRALLEQYNGGSLDTQSNALSLQTGMHGM